MASALQCPACGFKHRLSALGGDAVFACARCGRLLKTPVEYRRPEPSSPGGPPPPYRSSQVQRGGAATRDRTAVLPTATPTAPASPSGARSPVPPRSQAPRPRAPAIAGLPLRILAWLVALGLGALVVRYVARITGFLTGDTLIDLMTDQGYTRYVRLVVLVPFWALASAGFATLFIEGTRWWIGRRQASVGGAAGLQGQIPVRTPPAPSHAATPAVSGTEGRRGSTARHPVVPVPPPAPTPPGPDVPAQRTRRIPRRDVTS